MSDPLDDVRRIYRGADPGFTGRQVREVKECPNCGWVAPTGDRCGACAWSMYDNDKEAADGGQ